MLNAVTYLANLTTISMFISEVETLESGRTGSTACCGREPGGKSSLSVGRQPSRRAYVSLGLNQEDRWSWSHCSQAGQHDVCHSQERKQTLTAIFTRHQRKEGKQKGVFSTGEV